jgi:hypothetical protein
MGLNTSMIAGPTESPFGEVDKTRHAFAANVFHLPRCVFEQLPVIRDLHEPQSRPRDHLVRFADLAVDG